MDFSTALVVSLSTGLSSFGFSVLSPSSRCVTSMVYHDVALSSTHIDGQCRVGKMFKTCDSNHQAGKRAVLLNLPSFSTIMTLSSTIFDVEREPLNEPTSLKSNCSFSTFQAGSHIGRKSSVVILSPARLKKSESSSFNIK